jgi:hypothetical protein
VLLKSEEGLSTRCFSRLNAISDSTVFQTRTKESLSISRAVEANPLKCLMAMTACYHIIHANGLTEMLKGGSAEGMDEKDYWNLVDSTYVDEVRYLLFLSLVAQTLSLSADLTNCRSRKPSLRAEFPPTTILPT